MSIHQGSAVPVPSAEVSPSKSALRRAGRFTKSEVLYWIVVIGSSVLLLWGLGLAIEAIVQGKTVVLG